MMSRKDSLLLLETLPASVCLGMPIARALISCGMASGRIIAQNRVLGTDNLILLAILFFLLAGGPMNKSGRAGNIIGFAMALIGHVNGVPGDCRRDRADRDPDPDDEGREPSCASPEDCRPQAARSRQGRRPRSRACSRRQSRRSCSWGPA
ncbi:TRAP transporter large permease subunit [Mangrovicoccus ximenensis]|uniref:TRAP transporter large permease subunit n=1 Tax=Mangrovicoccus ximenensis TaxID=1911570 RepID=UPI000D36FE9A